GSFYNQFYRFKNIILKKFNNILYNIKKYFKRV
ncbi:Pyrroline-5-carboxylate reductase, partial [Bacillus cereus]